MKGLTLQAVAAFLPVLAKAASSPAPLTPTSSICNTKMGSTSVANVPTTTTTITNTLQPSITISTQTTKTAYSGAIYTYTTIKTVTTTSTQPTVTDTFSSTYTVLQTSTITVPSTVTTTATSTSTETSTSTTTVATTPGFKNIRDTINSYNFKKRDLDFPHPQKRAAQPAATQGVLAFAYPSRVDCTATLPNTNTKTFTSTLAPTTVTLPFWVGKTTTTSTITTTSVVVPPRATTTQTSFATSTISVSTTSFYTSTESTTTTATALIHGPTVYDACNDRNYFGANFQHSANGAQFNYYVSNVDNNGPNVGSNYQIVANGAGSMQECCNNCMAFGNCETFLFRARNRNCFLMYHDGASCPNQSQHPNFFLSASGTDTGAGYQLGNGLCGYTYSGNSNGDVYTVDNP